MQRIWITVSFFAVGIACFFSAAEASRDQVAVPGEILIGFQSGFSTLKSEQALRSALTQVRHKGN